MTKLKLPLLSAQATGSLGKLLTFQRTLRGTKAFKYTDHLDKSSTAQLNQRSRFLTARACWLTFSPSLKQLWNDLALAHTPQYISGYHAWLSYFLDTPFLNTDSHTIGFWRMDEPVWTGTFNDVIDSSGNGNNGLAYNSLSTVPSLLSRCGLFLYDANKYIDCGTSSLLLPVTSFTFSCLFKPSGDTQHFLMGCYDYNHSKGTRLSYLYDSTPIPPDPPDTSLSFFINGIHTYLTPCNLIDGKCHYICATYTPGTACIYLDGTLVKTSSFTESPEYSDVPFTIGASPSISFGPDPFLLDDVRVDNIALTQEQITSIWLIYKSLLNL